MHVWVDRVIGPVNGSRSSRGKRCCSVYVQCGVALSCGGVGKRSQWTSEGTEEE